MRSTLHQKYVARQGETVRILRERTCKEEQHKSIFLLPIQIYINTNLYTSELERLGILQRIEDRYHIEDKVFKMWLDLRKTGELGESPREKAVEIYLKIMERKYLKAKTELGKAKEIYRDKRKISKS